MKAKLFRRGTIGVAYGGMIIFIALTMYKILGIEETVSEFWPGSVGALLIGIYFGMASLIFDYEAWSPLKRTVIHFFLSLIVFYPIAISTGWFPLAIWPILNSLMIFVFIYTMFWFGAIWYLSKVKSDMNQSIK